MKRLNVVGTGRVGQTLARLWKLHGACEVQDLLARREESAREAAAFIGAGRPVARLADLRSADLWLISVPDAQVGAVAAQLAQHLRERGDAASALAFHCSGFLRAAELAPLQAMGWHAASVHPVLNFASPAAGVERFQGTPCGLEGDAEAVAALEPLFAAAGGVCFAVASEHKPLYHAAAVFASNFMVVLQAIGQEAWTASGVPADMITQVNGALVRATLENTLALGPARAITGPAARGDTAVVQVQGEHVARWHPEAGRIYQDMSVLARRLAVQGTTLPPTAPGAAP